MSSDSHDVQMGGGIVATIWRKHAQGRYRCVVTFPDATQIGTTDFRFTTIAWAHQWAKEVVAMLHERRVTA